MSPWDGLGTEYDGSVDRARTHVYLAAVPSSTRGPEHPQALSQTPIITGFTMAPDGRSPPVPAPRICGCPGGPPANPGHLGSSHGGDFAAHRAPERTGVRCSSSRKPPLPGADAPGVYSVPKPQGTSPGSGGHRPVGLLRAGDHPARIGIWNQLPMMLVAASEKTPLRPLPAPRSGTKTWWNIWMQASVGSTGTFRLKFAWLFDAASGR